MKKLVITTIIIAILIGGRVDTFAYEDKNEMLYNKFATDLISEYDKFDIFHRGISVAQTDRIGIWGSFFGRSRKIELYYTKSIIPTFWYGEKNDVIKKRVELVIAHEIGHSIFTTFQNTNYYNLMLQEYKENCVKLRPRKNETLRGDWLKVNENFAEMFSHYMTIGEVYEGYEHSYFIMNYAISLANTHCD